jgi:yadA domain-containing protein
MNKIFKVVKNASGGNIVASELAKGAGKGKHLTLSALAILCGAVMSNSFATPVSIQGVATSENSVSIGTDSFATSVDGVATGKSSVATGNGFTREEFATKKQENQAAIDAVNGKQAEVNNKNNDLTVAKEAIKQLDAEIDQLGKNQAAINDKINQKNQLENQKNNIQDQINQKQNELNDAKTKLDSVSIDGKNLLLNFTDILKTLNWSSLDGSENSKNVLANELKTKITQAAPEIASKYGDEKYRSTIDGYLNRQASYQGSKEYVTGTFGSNVLGALLKDNNLKTEIVNEGFFNKSLTETSYLGSEDNYTNQMEDGKYISELGITRRIDDTTPNTLNMDFEINNTVFGRMLDENGRYNRDRYRGLDEKGRFTYETFYYTGENGRRKGKAFSKEGFNQKTLNTAILRNESIKKAKATGEFNLLVESIGEATYIGHATNLSKTFTEDYNKAMLGNYSMYSRVLFGVKKTDGTVSKLFNIDKNIGVLSRLKDYTVDNSNLISTEDIAEFKKWFKSLKDYDASIDWNFDKSAINLTDYKQNLNKVIAYNTKIDEILDVYQSIIDERKKSDSDTVKIDNETKRLMALKDEVISGVADMSNYVAGITPTYNKQWADYYLNYGKAEADKVVARINNELKLYNDKDELVVETTNKAKEIQDNYDKAKKALDDKKAELDKVNKNINDLNLTTEEEKNDEVKRAKEAEKADREADKTRLEDEIKKGEDELAGLKEKLSKTSLKDLGLRSQAHGSGAFASGDDSIAMGTNATVTKADGIAIGQNTNVTGEKSIAIGKDSEVSGEKSIAIGVGHNVSGNHSTTIGDPNVVSGNDSFVAGNGNNVASNNVMVLGNNITVATGYDNAVVLGEGSTAEKANPTSSITIKDQTYNFAGTNPTSTVSVGKAGAERQIVNVAAGRISDTSTDAINGSQLYAAVEGIKNSSVNPEQVSDEVVNVLRTKLVAGDNIDINEDQATNTFTVTGKGPKVVGGKNAKVEETKADGITTYTVNVEAEPVKLEEGDNVHVKTIENVDGSKSYKLSADKTTVSSGTGISVETTNTTNDETGAVTTNYKVSLSEELSKQIAKEESVTAGSNNLTVTQNGTNETGGKNFVVDLAKSIDLTPEGSLKIGDVILNKDGLNNGRNKIINVANGTNPTDAVNLQQLNATKVEVVAGDKVNVETKTNEDGSKVYTVKALTSQVKGGNNVSVEETKDESGASVYTAKVEGDLTNITSISNGDTKLSLGDNIINANGARIGNIGAPTEANDATNKDYVDNSRNTVSSKDGTIKITSTTTNATTGAVNYDLSLSNIKGLASRTDDGVNTNYQLGDTMLISGDNKNISTITDNGRIRVKLADDIKANSVTTGNVSISTKGVNAGGLKVTNVAPGEISQTSTDAVNGSQLYRTNQQVINNAVNIGRLGDNVNQLNNRMGDVENRIGRVENRMDKLNKQRKAGHASGLATAGLLQAHRSGQSGVTAAVGQYQGATAVAVGYSRLSDNGKVGIKLSLTTNTQKEVGGTVGVGYFW